MPKDSKELKEKLMQIVNAAVDKDNGLRAELKIGDKFRFIRERLLALQKNIDDTLKTIKTEVQENKSTLAEDEALVYVYLFNAHGIDLKSWIKMLHPSVYYEYSVNRPIYGEKSHIEAVIRNKTSRVQHGYLTVAVKKDLILRKGDEGFKDNLGNPLLKIKEGSLRPERLMSLTHNDHEYVLNEDGALEKIS
jgi:CRISPR/Cas system-associated exonuclease Cas4 (RecB family)